MHGRDKTSSTTISMLILTNSCGGGPACPLHVSHSWFNEIQSFHWPLVRVYKHNMTGDLFCMSLQKQLTCPVCTEHFKEPKVLPCLHYYCKTCIADMIKRAKGPRFNCPECRREARAAHNKPRKVRNPTFSSTT